MSRTTRERSTPFQDRGQEWLNKLAHPLTKRILRYERKNRRFSTQDFVNAANDIETESLPADTHVPWEANNIGRLRERICGTHGIKTYTLEPSAKAPFYYCSETTEDPILIGWSKADPSHLASVATGVAGDNAQVIVTCGPEKSGKTVLCARFVAAWAAEGGPNKNVRVIASASSEGDDGLRPFDAANVTVVNSEKGLVQAMLLAVELTPAGEPLLVVCIDCGAFYPKTTKGKTADVFRTLLNTKRHGGGRTFLFDAHDPIDLTGIKDPDLKLYGSPYNRTRQQLKDEMERLYLPGGKARITMHHTAATYCQKVEASAVLYGANEVLKRAANIKQIPIGTGVTLLRSHGKGEHALAQGTVLRCRDSGKYEVQLNRVPGPAGQLKVTRENLEAPVTGARVFVPVEARYPSPDLLSSYFVAEPVADFGPHIIWQNEPPSVVGEDSESGSENDSSSDSDSEAENPEPEQEAEEQKEQEEPQTDDEAGGSPSKKPRLNEN
jgi:hypothetical protein